MDYAIRILRVEGLELETDEEKRKIGPQNFEDFKDNTGEGLIIDLSSIKGKFLKLKIYTDM